MRCKVAGQPVGARQLFCRVMNYGQPIAGMPALELEIRIGRGEVCDKLAAVYAQLVVSLQEDLPHDDGADEDTRELSRLGWPGLGELWQLAPQRLGALLVGKLAIDALNTLFAVAIPELDVPVYCINQLDSAQVTDEAVFLRGKAYPYARS